MKTDFYKEICVCQENWSGIDCSQKSYSFKTMASANFIDTTKSMKIIKNLTNTSSKHDLHDYLNWLNINYGISKTPNRYQQPLTTPFISHKYSIKKIPQLLEMIFLFL
jgi:hypothetical protein